MAAFVGHPNALLLLNKTYWEAATLKGVITNGWAPDIDTDLLYSDISAYEIALSGYTAGGVTLGNALVELGTGGLVHYRADDATWAALGAGTVAIFALVADSGGTVSIIGHIDISAKQPDGGTYTVEAATDGWLTDSWGA